MTKESLFSIRAKKICLKDSLFRKFKGSLSSILIFKESSAVPDEKDLYQNITINCTNYVTIHVTLKVHVSIFFADPSL